MNKIKVAIAGVGNCASSLVQGVEYYRQHASECPAGLMHPDVGGWAPGDLEFVAAFDVDRRKVGAPLEEAVFARPNCTMVFQPKLSPSGVVVRMAPVLDAFRDQVLYLKHNLNLSAIAALEGEAAIIESDVDELIAEMQRSIAEADAFISHMLESG